MITEKKNPDRSSSDVSLTDYMPTCFCLLRNVKVWKELNSKTNLQHTPVRQKEKLRAEGSSPLLHSTMLYKITFRGLIGSLKILCSWISGHSF